MLGGAFLVTQLNDFAPEESNLLRSLPLLISVTSLIFIQPSISAMLDAVLSLYSMRLSKPSSLKAIRSLFLLLRPSVFRALRTVLILGTIWDDTSKPFPAIRAMFEADTSEGPPDFNEIDLFLREKSPDDTRNNLCSRAIAILISKNLYHEAEEYKGWLLQIARETIRRGQFRGFLKSSKDAQMSRVTGYLQDFAQALQIPPAENIAEEKQTLNHNDS